MTEDELLGYDAKNFEKYLEYHMKYDFSASYFRKLEIILKKINLEITNDSSVLSTEYDFKEKNVMSVDLVKCASEKWGLTNEGKMLYSRARKKLIQNCSEHLWNQIDAHKPKYIICNGIDVSKAFYEKYITSKVPFTIGIMNNLVYHVGKNHQFTIFLSGYINHLDNLSKIRIAENIIREIKNRTREGIN